MNLGENIRRARLERGLTQSALAEALGVSDKAVSRWERNISAPRHNIAGSAGTAAGDLRRRTAGR